MNDLPIIFGGFFGSGTSLLRRPAGKLRWAEKNPENVVYVARSRALLPGGFNFVRIVRRPLDVLASLKRRPFPKRFPLASRKKSSCIDFTGRPGQRSAGKCRKRASRSSTNGSICAIFFRRRKSPRCSNGFTFAERGWHRRSTGRADQPSFTPMALGVGQ